MGPELMFTDNPVKIAAEEYWYAWLTSTNNIRNILLILNIPASLTAPPVQDPADINQAAVETEAQPK